MSSQFSVGIDVSALTLAVALRPPGGSPTAYEFENDHRGHCALVKKLTKAGRSVRVCVEATGRYSLDLAMALHAAARVEVMVANPASVHAFAKALMKRSKTDPDDALVLLEFAERMPFVAWSPPPKSHMELREVVRRVQSLTAIRSAELNRLEAATASEEASRMVVEDLRDSVAVLTGRIERMTQVALGVARAEPTLRRRLELLLSIKGVAETSAIRILGELATLPDDMTAKQWVAHAGLAPRQRQSGTSVRGKARISKVGNKHLRTSLFYPAMVASTHEATVKAFKDELVARGKPPLVAVTAVMRKMLHCIHGMWATDTPWDPDRFRGPQKIA